MVAGKIPYLSVLARALPVSPSGCGRIGLDRVGDTGWLSTRKLNLLRIARVFFPITVFLATLIAGIRLGAFNNWSDPVTSPLTAIFGLGLPIFPGATYVICQGFLNRVPPRAKLPRRQALSGVRFGCSIRTSA